MTDTAEIWKTDSSVITQTFLSIWIIAIGFVLIIGVNQFPPASLIGARVGYALGLISVFSGFWMLIFARRQIVTVEKYAQRIMIEYITRFGEKRQEILFNEIEDVYLGEFGDGEGGRIAYHVVVELKNGKKIALFNGFFQGTHNKNAMEAKRRRIARYLDAR